jgi:hypothetical protein
LSNLVDRRRHKRRGYQPEGNRLSRLDGYQADGAVFVGETIYAESEVVSTRESVSRPTQGIVTVRTTGSKVDGTVFLTYRRTVLVPKREHGIAE